MLLFDCSKFCSFLLEKHRPWFSSKHVQIQVCWRKQCRVTWSRRATSSPSDCCLQIVKRGRDPEASGWLTTVHAATFMSTEIISSGKPQANRSRWGRSVVLFSAVSSVRSARRLNIYSPLDARPYRLGLLWATLGSTDEEERGAVSL